MDHMTKEAIRYLGYGKHAVDDKTCLLYTSGIQRYQGSEAYQGVRGRRQAEVCGSEAGGRRDEREVYPLSLIHIWQAAMKLKLAHPRQKLLEKRQRAADLEQRLRLLMEACLETVSYTHLDVYKRQTERCGKRSLLQ